MARLIAIEGIDGSGKGTHAARLLEILQSEGRSVALLGFPRYQATFFGARVAEFLNGAYGTLDEVHPFLAAVLYAGDRFESRELLGEAMEQHEIVLLDRYVASNIAHQGAKLEGEARRRLCGQIDHLEHSLYGLPRPDRVILLDLPVTVSRTLVAKKGVRNYTEQTADLQEADADYQDLVRHCYLELAQTTEYWRQVNVVQDGRLRSVDEVAADVRQAAE